MRSLVVQTSFIGDVVLTTPLLTRLAERGPVDVVTTPAGESLLRSHPAVDRVITYDKHGSDRGPAAFARVARAARGASAGYLAQGSIRSAALAHAAGCRHRIGFSTSAGSWLYTRRVEYRDDWHHARRLLSLASPAPHASRALHADAGHDRSGGRGDIGDVGDAGLEDAIRPRLYPTAADVAAVDALLVGRHRPLIVVAPGSAWPTKRWPGMAQLTRLLDTDHDVAIVGGPADAPAAAAILREARRVGGERIVDAVGRLSLLGSAELIGRSLLLVTNDSAPQHLASAVGTPTVTLFGPTVPAFGFGPLAPGSRSVGVATLACRPCDRHGPVRCPLGHWRCMNEIIPAEVNEMVGAMIATRTHQ